MNNKTTCESLALSPPKSLRRGKILQILSGKWIDLWGEIATFWYKNYISLLTKSTTCKTLQVRLVVYEIGKGLQEFEEVVKDSCGTHEFTPHEWGKCIQGCQCTLDERLLHYVFTNASIALPGNICLVTKNEWKNDMLTVYANDVEKAYSERKEVVLNNDIWSLFFTVDNSIILPSMYIEQQALNHSLLLTEKQFDLEGELLIKPC